ncbi:hypothetical protein V8G54_018033 [Vigna mungo]|uniref:Retrotransposon gag domain-containing protein n=1 Tax=Vigna mungo TaxID=3915 RepID=A0AAQ3N8W5_VIGMU
MLITLSAKNKVELIDGSTPRPLASDRKASFEWTVQRKFGAISNLGTHRLEASSLKQGDLTITDYFTQLRVIWDELENFRPDSFLRGLNDQYANVLSHVLLMDPLPPINKIFSYVTQQERQYFIPDIFHAETKQNSINVVNAHTTTVFACAFCGRSGHTKSTCYCKHDFPNHSDSKTSNSVPTRGKICSYYGKTGHTIEVCYKKHEYPPGHRFFNAKFSSANSVLLTKAPVAKKEQHPGSKNSEIQFTPQQYQALLALI